MEMDENIMFLRMAGLIGLSVLFAGSSVQAEEAVSKPNVLFIFADDQTFESIGAYGLTEVKTPNLDRLVERGVSFTHAYNMGAWNGAVCAASRAMLNSGTFVNRAQETIKTKPHWSEMMKGAGYTTYMTGKWHVPGEPRFDVVKDVRPGMPKQTPEGYNRPKDEADYANGWKPWETKYGGFWEGGTHWTDIVANNTLEFFEQAKKDDKPFFMYLAFNASHDPRQAPKEYIDMYPLDSIKVPENFLAEYPYADAICGKQLRDERLMPYPRTEYAVKVNRQEYYATITYMDHHIGRMLDALEASGRADNTYIIFTADHGLAVGHHGLVGKQNMYEHSMRPPFIITGPGLKPNTKIDTPIYLQDAMATALDLAGIEKPSQVEFQSLMPLLKGEKTVQYESIYGKYMHMQRMILKGDWKLVFYPFAEKKMRLFNVKRDPMEMHDQIDNPEYASLVKKLRADFIALQKGMGDDLDLDHPVKPKGKFKKSNGHDATPPTKAPGKVIPKMNATITASDNGAKKHPPESMFDGDKKTKYYSAKIQFPAEFTISLNDGAKVATGYTLTSGNDMPGRDPKSWEFYGSNNDSKWILLDTRSNETFEERHQERTFTISKPQPFSAYKLQVTESAGSGLQMAEIGMTWN
jgi:arylsulfatase A-like enzyme